MTKRIALLAAGVIAAGLPLGLTPIGPASTTGGSSSGVGTRMRDCHGDRENHQPNAGMV
jgi:hypothetical protein